MSEEKTWLTHPMTGAIVRKLTVSDGRSGIFQSMPGKNRHHRLVSRIYLAGFNLLGQGS